MTPVGRMRMRIRRCNVYAIIVLAAVLICSPSARSETVSGHCRNEKVLGRPGAYLPLYEWNVYLSRDGHNAATQSFRVGLPPQPDQSFFTFNVAPGTYSLLLDEPVFWGRPTVVPNIVVGPGQTIQLDVSHPADYGCAFGSNSGEWGQNPFTASAREWYQTFIATGTAITGVNFKLHQSNATQMQVTLHADNGGPITAWPQVGVARTRDLLPGPGDQWLRYRSNEIPTAPGHRYAMKFTGGGAGDPTFSIFRRWDAGQGFAGGQAFTADGTPQNFDLYGNVFCDKDGTVTSYCAVMYDLAALTTGTSNCGQTVVAMGESLAAANLLFAASPTWDITATMRIRQGGPGGAIIGPAKTAKAASLAANSGFLAAVWNPGEVPLTPGQTYYIEVDRPGGYNPAKFTHGGNSYLGGQAFIGGNPQSGVDFHMQVVEYAAPPVPPMIGVNRSVIELTAARGQSPLDTTFTVTNTGGGVLSYAISDDAGWLATSPTIGVSHTQPNVIGVSFDTALLPTGTYHASIAVSAAGANNSPQEIQVQIVIPTPGDFDADGDVDQTDFGRFQSCYSGPGAPQIDTACAPARLDADEDVDQNDFGLFQACISGPGLPADATCAP